MFLPLKPLSFQLHLFRLSDNPMPIKIQDQFTRKKVSSQRRSQLRNVARGLCMTCGKPRKTYSHRCDACERKRGFRAWKPGSKGHAPKTKKECI
jgi:hypothetical protein